MAKSVLDIVIKLTKEGGADKETVKGLAQLKQGIIGASAVAGTLVAAGYTIKKAFDATVGTMVAYADQVRSVAQMTGLSAEESSKLIQITDDMKVSFESLQKVIQKNGDAYDFSVAGLAAMSEQYNRLGTAQEKADFMQKRFGKSWGEFVELMEQGGDKIRAAGDDINEGLILDQKALDSARDYQKQLDELSDSWQAFKVSTGSAALPATVDLLDRLNAEIEEEGGNLIQAEKGWRMLLGPIGAVWNAIDLFTNKSKDALTVSQQADAARLSGLASLYATTDAVEGLTEATKEESEANREFLGLLGTVSSIHTNYTEDMNDLTAERMRLEGEKQALQAQGYTAESQQIQDVNAQLEENKNKISEVGATFDLENKKIMLGYLERKLTADGVLDDKELLWLTEKGVAWGIYHAEAVAEVKAMVAEANSLIAGIQQSATFTLSLNTIYGQYGDGARTVGGGARRAHGTDGWESVPRGFPNDSFPVWMTSGEKFAVIPPGGGGAVNSNQLSGGGAVSITVNINSMVNTADREKVKQELLPVILDGIRSAQAQGMTR